jgi:cytochrome c553
VIERILLAGASTLAVLLASCASPPKDDRTIAAEVEPVCSFCHGNQGHAKNPAFPNLAGQHAEYLDVQLHNFRDRSRGDSRAHVYMWGVAANLSDGTIAQLAAHYASMPAAAGTADPTPRSESGRKIFHEGIERQDVPACVGCHLEYGEGAREVPRLAGQNRAYLERQLTAFASRDRANDIMHETTKNLTSEQIEEIARYLSTL